MVNTFSHLIGNQPVKEMLTSLLERGSIPSVFLFSGPEGVGKALFAKAFAYALMNTRQVSPIDYFHVKPDEKSGLHSMEMIRHIIDHIYILPHEAPYKVYLIEDVHGMLPVHMNALLKTLEEPPPHAKIILTTHRKEALLDTVLSRVVEIPFQQIPDQELYTYLEKHHPQSAEQAAKKVKNLDGSLKNLSFYLSEEFTQVENTLLKGLQAFFTRHHSLSLLYLDEMEQYIQSLDEKEKNLAEDFALRTLLFWVRDRLSIQFKIDQELFFSEEKESFHQMPPFPERGLEKLLEQYHKAYDALDRNVSFRSVFESILFALR